MSISRAKGLRRSCKLSLEHLTAPNYLHLLEHSGPVSGIQEPFSLATHGIQFTFNQKVTSRVQTFCRAHLKGRFLPAVDSVHFQLQKLALAILCAASLSDSKMQKRLHTVFKD